LDAGRASTRGPRSIKDSYRPPIGAGRNEKPTHPCMGQPANCNDAAFRSQLCDSEGTSKVGWTAPAHQQPSRPRLPRSSTSKLYRNTYASRWVAFPFLAWIYGARGMRVSVGASGRHVRWKRGGAHNFRWCWTVAESVDPSVVTEQRALSLAAESSSWRGPARPGRL
jgi:hypothetical protein